MASLRPPEADVGALRAPMRSCLSILGLFVLLLLALALLERLGIGTGRIPFTLVVVGAGFGLAVALLSHGRRSADFYAADGLVVARLGGLAVAGMLAGALLIVAGSEFSVASPEFVAAASGLVLGVALSGLLIAPRLRRADGYSPGDFVAARFGGAARLAAAIAACAVSFLIFISCLKSAAMPITALTGLAERDAINAVAILVALAVLPGGMRALTWTQIFQYFVAALACLVPAAILAVEGGADPRAPGQGFGALLGSLQSWPPPQGATPVLSTLLLFAAGTVVLPPLLMRAYAAPSPQHAASTMLWSLLFVIVLATGGLALADGLPSSPGPAFAGLDAVLAGLVMAGVFAAILSLAEAALFSASAALSRDVWQAVRTGRGREGRRIFAARLVVIVVAAGGAAFTQIWPLEAAETLAWALAVSAAGILVPIVAGLFWTRCTGVAAAAGMLTGFGVLCLVLSVKLGLMPAWLAPRAAGFEPAPAAALGALASLVVTVGTSLARFIPGEVRGASSSAVRPDRGAAQPLSGADQ